MKAHSLTYSTCYLSFCTTTHCYNCIKTSWRISTCCSQTHTLESPIVSGKVSIITIKIYIYCNRISRYEHFLLETHTSLLLALNICVRLKIPKYSEHLDQLSCIIFAVQQSSFPYWSIIQTNLSEFHHVPSSA